MAAVAVRGDLVAATVPTSTIFEILRDTNWQTRNQTGGSNVPIASMDTVDYLRANHKDNLNEFGTAKILAADMLRFTDPSMVLGNANPTMIGVDGARRSGWNGQDQEREGKFQAEFSDMLLRAKQDEERYRTSH